MGCLWGQLKGRRCGARNKGLGRAHLYSGWGGGKGGVYNEGGRRTPGCGPGGLPSSYLHRVLRRVFELAFQCAVTACDSGLA